VREVGHRGRDRGLRARAEREREGTRMLWKRASMVTCPPRLRWTTLRADAERGYTSPAPRKGVRGELRVSADAVPAA
jgi:hypothetical protein